MYTWRLQAWTCPLRCFQTIQGLPTCTDRPPKQKNIVPTLWVLEHALQVLFDNEYRRAYERLLRKLLNYPKHPAVVLMHSYNWMAPPIGRFWNTIERELLEFAYYYDLPSLSLKAATHTQMRHGVEGFQVGAWAHQGAV